VQCPQGYFTRYESYLRRVTPKDSSDCSNAIVAHKQGAANPFERFMSIFKKKPDSTATVPVTDTGGPVSKNQD
jgi:hypothetical protein